MKSFLIKLGKAWSTIRREGLWKAGRRIASALSAQRAMRRVEAGDILIITNGVGDSARYRARHVAEELRHNGFRASVTIQDNRKLFSYAGSFSVFVFHRVIYTAQVGAFVKKIKGHGKEIIFETDDLTYDPSFLKYMAGYQNMNRLEKKLYENGLGSELVNDPYVKVATTTTTYLADELRKVGKRVFVVRNKVSQADREFTDHLLRAPKKNDALIRMAYFSGTASHNKDFAAIAGPLTTLLGKYQHIRLVLVGPLDTGPEFNTYEDQIERVSFVPWQRHFVELAAMDINLAPLEVGNPFCEAKSELKFFEAGLVKVPTVAAATRTFKEAITDGVDGFVALSKDEWREKLEKLILDPELRCRMGEKARETALMRYTTENGKSEGYYNYLKEKIV